MKYIRLNGNEYLINQDIDDFNETEFNNDLNLIKDNVKIELHSSIVNTFMTPLILLIITFALVAITSVLVIALGLIIGTNLVYIPLGVAYALYVALVVIVLVDRKRKDEYMKNPKICLGQILSDAVGGKSGFILEYNIHINGNIEKETIFVKTNLNIATLKVAKKEFCEEYVAKGNIFILVYEDRKRFCYPVNLYYKQ